MIWLEVPACHTETSGKATGQESELMHKLIMHECINSVKRGMKEMQEMKEQSDGNVSAWHSWFRGMTSRVKA